MNPVQFVHAVRLARQSVGLSLDAGQIKIALACRKAGMTLVETLNALELV